MPIRFRCAYCNQLMGIGRRKAGSIVRCPRCAGEVIVPAEHDKPAPNGAGPLNDLLESEDFGKALAAVERAPLAPPKPLMPPIAFDQPLPKPQDDAPPLDLLSEPIPRDLRRPGLFLPTPLLVAAAALLIAAIAVTFTLGMLVMGLFR